MCGSQGTDPNDLGGNADGGASNDPPGTPFTDPFANTPAYVPTKPKGDTSHNAGRACSQKGCHGKGGEGPSFLIGGTVYSDYADAVPGADGGTAINGTPAVGVEVRVIDTNGNAISTYSQSNGNFYISSSNAGSVALPAYVGVRNASSTRPMITELTGTMGDCAQAGCHVGTSAGGYYPIHVP